MQIAFFYPKDVQFFFCFWQLNIFFFFASFWRNAYKNRYVIHILAETVSMPLALTALAQAPDSGVDKKVTGFVVTIVTMN